jgi:hypothetical protein
MSKVPFKPNGMQLLVQVPAHVYKPKVNDKGVAMVMTDATVKSLRTDYLTKGDKLEVMAVGDECKFVKVGDFVSVNTRGMVELNLDGIDEPFTLVREAEVLGKFL